MHMPPLAWLVAVASCPAIWLPGREISTLVDPMASTFNDAVETRAFAALDAPQSAFLNGSALSARSVATCVSAHKPLFGPNAAQFISINTTTDSNTTFITPLASHAAPADFIGSLAPYSAGPPSACGELPWEDNICQCSLTDDGFTRMGPNNTEKSTADAPLTAERLLFDRDARAKPSRGAIVPLAVATAD